MGKYSAIFKHHTVRPRRTAEAEPQRGLSAPAWSPARRSQNHKSQMQIKEAGGRKSGENGGLGNRRSMRLFKLTVFFKTKIKVGVIILRQKKLPNSSYTFIT